MTPTPLSLSLLSLIAVGNISDLVKDFNEIKPGQTGRPQPGGASSIDLRSSLMRPLYGFQMISDYLPFWIKYITRQSGPGWTWLDQAGAGWEKNEIMPGLLTGGQARPVSAHRPIKHISEGFFVKQQDRLGGGCVGLCCAGLESHNSHTLLENWI